MENKPASEPAPMATLDRPPRGALATYGQFLVGNAEAIRRLAATPRLWLVGLLFTFSAGLAREYDAEDLLAEPWHLLIAPGASLIAATALWLFIHFTGLRHWAWSRKSTGGVQEAGVARPRLHDNYLGFLALFWLTAPLAWLYGIPYERFQDAGTAASSNLWTLTLIALWRVLLMIRVLHVLYGINPFAATAIVLVFGDVLMLTAIALFPVPMIGFMGGVRLGPAEQVLASATFAAQILGTLGGFLLVAFWLVALVNRGLPWRWLANDPIVPLRPLIVLGVFALIWWSGCWLAVLSEQRLRHRIEQAMITGDLITGVNLLEQHYPQDLPPHWDPPPRRDGRDYPPDPLAVLLYLSDRPTTTTVRQLYEEKLIDNGMYLRAWTRERVLALLMVLEVQADSTRLMHGIREQPGVIEWLEEIAAKETDNTVRERLQTVLQRYRK